MASQGPFLPASGVTDGSTSFPWFNPGNVTADDGNLASIGGSAGFGFGDRLVATNFGFSLPAGATIDGIVVELNDAAQPAGFSIPAVGLTRDGTSVYASGVPAIAPGSGWVSYGGATDKWGVSPVWTDSEINSSTLFGVIIVSGEDNFEDWSVQLDAIRVTVYYTDPIPQQYAYPDADVAAGSWTPSTGATLWGVLDETGADDDADYITGVGV